MFKVGFTGTRHGMSDAQKEVFKKLINAKKLSEFHHGMCVGSDEQAHNFITEIKDKKNIKIVGHPPRFKGSLANCKCDVLRKTDEYLVRNRNIVDQTDVLIATPDTREKVRSGTWSTVRYARRQGRKIYILHKNGRVTIE